MADTSPSFHCFVAFSVFKDVQQFLFACVMSVGYRLLEIVSSSFLLSAHCSPGVRGAEGGGGGGGQGMASTDLLCAQFVTVSKDQGL